MRGRRLRSAVGLGATQLTRRLNSFGFRIFAAALDGRIADARLRLDPLFKRACRYTHGTSFSERRQFTRSHHQVDRRAA